MTNEITPSAPHRDFEGIKKFDESGIEYWEARELLPILGYEKWEKAEEVIARAARACMNSGQDVDNHFNRTVKMVKIGSNTMREVRDYKLDRYACYLIAQNGDPNKPEIALAQTYFAIQTRRQEVYFPPEFGQHGKMEKWEQSNVRLPPHSRQRWRWT